MVQFLPASAGFSFRHSQAVDRTGLVLSLCRTRGGQPQSGPGWESHALQAQARLGVEREWGEDGWGGSQMGSVFS